MTTGIDLWALEATASLLAEQGLDRLKWSWRWKLAQRTSEHIDNASRRSIRAFLARGETFSLLSRGMEEDAVQLHRGLVDSLGKKRLLSRRPDNAEIREAIADQVIPVLLNQFLRVLEPNSTVVVANERQMRELQAIRESQASVEAALRPATMTEELIAQLPPNARQIARDLAAADQRVAITLMESIVLDERTPGESVAFMVGTVPGWLADAGYRAWLCLAEIALGHSRGQVAAMAFDQAVQSGSPQSSRWHARAALAALSDDEASLAEEQIRKAEEAGGDLLVPVVEAALAEDETRIASAAQAAIDFHHPDSGLALGVLANVEFLRGRWDECVAVARRRLELEPDATSSRLLLARALLARIRAGRTAHPNHDWRDARQELRFARDLRRQWRGPSHEPVALACQGALLLHDLGLCLTLGRPFPGGEATDDEAQAPEVVDAVVHAAIMLNRLDVARPLVEALEDGRETRYLRGLLAEAEGDRTLAATIYSALADDAEGLQQLSGALMNLASLGVWPLPRVDELRKLDAEHADLAVAMAHLSAGRAQEAIRLARPHQSLSGMKLLAMAEVAAGELENAVATYEATFDLYREGDALVEAARLILSTDDFGRAESEINRYLGLIPGGTPARMELHRLRIAVAEHQGRWADVATHSQAYLDEEDEGDPEITWALLFALNNVGQIAAAVRIVTEEAATLPVGSRDAAKLLLTLLREPEPSEALVDRVLRLGWDYEDDEEVAAGALMVAYERSSTISPLNPDLVSSLHQLTEAFVARFPESDFFRRVSFDRIEDLVPQLRQQFRGAPFTEVADAVRRISEESHPQGVLATITGKSYAELLLARPAGVTPTVRPGPEVKEREREISDVALGASLVVDESALATFSLLPDHWREVRANFHELSIHPGAARDVQNGRVALRQRGTTTLGWDPDADQPIVHTIDEEHAESLANRAEWMARTAETLKVPNEGELSSTLLPAQTPAPERFAAWIGPIELARQLGVPLLTDDVGQQFLAESEGIEVISSVALFEALLASGRIPADLGDRMRAVLLRNWVVDLVPSGDEILELARESEWRPGPAPMQLSRPAFWTDPRTAFDAIRRIQAAVHREAPDAESTWIAATFRGAARAAPSEADWQRLASMLATHSLWLSGWSSEVLRDVLGAARLVAMELGREDPVTSIASYVYDLLRKSIGDVPAGSELVRLMSDLDEQDRLEVLRAVLQA